MELHYVLAPFMAFAGVSIIVLGSFMAFWKLSEGTEIRDVRVGHALTVMLFGLVLVFVAHIFSLIDAWKRLRGSKIEIDVNLEGYVLKKELKRSAIK